MSIYTNVNGVMRKIPDVHMGGYGHALKVMAGVNGVAREVWTRVDELDHVEIRVEHCGVTDNNNNIYSKESKSYLLSYGSYSVSSNSMSVTCDSDGRYCYLIAHLYLVSKDGDSIWFPNVMNRISGKSVVADTYTYQSAHYTGSTSGTWGWSAQHGVWVFGNDHCQSVNGGSSISNSASGYNTDTWNGNSSNARFEIGAGVITSLTTAYIQMRFDSITIGGKSFPIVLRDELTG